MVLDETVGFALEIDTNSSEVAESLPGEDCFKTSYLQSRIKSLRYYRKHTAEPSLKQLIVSMACVRVCGN